ncbi:transmembrane protein 92-like [Arvicanthis niloticus]|uniref:transmembrane protein 92-like n=1 Tax=Arvicanthis niloticus TaxID=61156 RepID=UPI0014874802|nr:transmembrane protein 92-like [Arvicanthis niloticus]
MQDTWILGALTLIFGLLSSLQGVSTNETLNTCDILNCPKGVLCCDNECCLEKKVWNPENEPFRIMLIILLIMLPLLCICGLVRRFCPNCRKLQHDVRTSDHQAPPDPPSIAPLESIWVTSLDPPPPYSQVVLKSTPIEPPPPYSLSPEGPAVQMRGAGYDTL